jgi:cation diffusion facilitator CzcD-associated flavoprotein CzcO
MAEVGIVGAGVRGVVVLRELSRKFSCVVYEAQDRPGGVWTNRHRVPYLALQMASHHYRFPDSRIKWREDMPAAASVQRYVEGYLRETGLSTRVRYGLRVTSWCEDPAGVTVQLSDGTSAQHKWLIYTGEATDPRVPARYTAHARWVHTAWLRAPPRSTRRAVVIGGSKSAAEACVFLRQQGVQVTWVARRFYSYAIFAPGSTIAWTALLESLPMVARTGSMHWLFPHRVRGTDVVHMGSGNFLTQRQYDALRSVRRVRGEVAAVCRDSVRLRSGETLPCELLVLGTGYHKNDGHSGNRVLFAGTPTARIGSFGTLNSHLIACTLAAYLPHASDGALLHEFALRFREAHAARLWMFELQYLLTAGRIGSFTDYV